MNTDSYLLIGFETLKNKTVILEGVEVDAIFNNMTYRDKKTFGFEAQDSCIITVKTSILTTDSRNYLKKLVTIDSINWEIVATQKGSATTQFTLINPNTL